MHTRITELRKSGKLDEAYNLAIQEYKKDKDNFLIESAFSWVLYNLIKNSNNFEDILKYSNEFLELDIEKGGDIDIYGMISGVFSKFIKNNFKTLDEQFIFINEKYKENGNNIFLNGPYSWNLYNIIKGKLEKKDLKGLELYINLLNNLNVERGGEFDIYEILSSQFYKVIKTINDTNKYKLALFYYSKLKNYKPSKTHSFILFDVINRYKKNENNFSSNFDFYGFIKLWGIENFQYEDYEEGEFNGKTTQSTFEKVISILGNIIKTTDNINKLGDILELETILEKGINKDLKWAGLYLGKLKLLDGDFEGAEKLIKKIVKKEKTQFWSWHLLGEVIIKQGKNELYFSALAKSLSCGGDDKFLNNLREEFIKELVKNNLFDEANIELNKIIKNKIENKSRITDSLNILIKSNWYIEETNGNNKNFYNKNTELIEDYLYSDIEDIFIYVDYVNKDKYVINFKDKNKNKGFFNFKSFKNLKIKKGDIIKVKIEKVEDEYYNVYKIYDDKYDILDFFDYISDELIYISFINKEKNIINFSTKNRDKGFFNYGNFDINGLNKGDIINVKIEKQEQEYFNIYKLETKKYSLNDMFGYDEIIIEYINTNKKIINFVGNYKHGFFNYNGYENIIEGMNVGDILDIIFIEEKGEFYTIGDLKKSDNQEDTNLKTIISGSISIREGNDFGFLDDVFVGGNLLMGIEDGDYIRCEAVKSYNKKKYNIGWKVISII